MPYQGETEPFPGEQPQTGPVVGMPYQGETEPFPGEQPQTGPVVGMPYQGETEPFPGEQPQTADVQRVDIIEQIDRPQSGGTTVRADGHHDRGAEARAARGADPGKPVDRHPGRHLDGQPTSHQPTPIHVDRTPDGTSMANPQATDQPLFTSTGTPDGT